MDLEQEQRAIPRYQSHKQVGALKIKSVETFEDGTAWIKFHEEGFGLRELGSEWVKKHNPKPGGYYVVYADGYESWSPAAAFEEGYSLAPQLEPEPPVSEHAVPGNTIAHQKHHTECPAFVNVFAECDCLGG